MKPSKPAKYKIVHYRLRLVRDRVVRYPAPHANCSTDTVAIMRALLGDADREKMVALYLNAQNVPVGAETVAVGGLHSVSVSMREIFKGAIAATAARIMLGHNHPSGDPTPSQQDRQFTRLAEDASAILGIPLVDHVIVCPSGKYASFYDLGMLRSEGPP